MRLLTSAFVVFLGGCATQVAVSEPFEASAARDEAREVHDDLIARDRSLVAALRREECDDRSRAGLLHRRFSEGTWGWPPTACG